MQRIILVTFICWLFSIRVFAQAQSSRLQITHLTGNFYIYTTFNTYKGEEMPANGMYLITDQGAVMFDTPWDSTQFQPLLDSIKVKHQQQVILCIATHFHEDRTGGLEFYTRQGIKTYTTKQTDEISKVRNQKRASQLMYSDTLFNVGKYAFQTYYPGAGHSPDNIVIWFAQDKILYGGCLIKSVEAADLGNLGDASIKDWATTIKNIQQKFKTPRYVIPGHQSWADKNSLEHTLSLISKAASKK